MSEEIKDINIDIAEGAEYSLKSEFSKALLCYDAYKNAMHARGKDMRKGYFNTTVSKEGLPIRVYIEDTRKVYCGAVKSLRIAMQPEIKEVLKEHEDAKKETKKVKLKTTKWEDQDLEAIKKKYLYYPYIQKDGVYVRDKEKGYLPELDEMVKILIKHPTGQTEIKMIPGAWNRNLDRYWDEMVDACDKLLTSLMVLIHEKNYFKPKIGYG